jgi:hypothetical protein
MDDPSLMGIGGATASCRAMSSIPERKRARFGERGEADSGKYP